MAGLLFATANPLGPRFSVEVVFAAGQRTAGASLAVYSRSEGARPAETGALHRSEIGGTQGRGCQGVDRVRLGLENGLYRLEVRYSSGGVKKQDFEVAGSHLFLEVTP